MELIVPEILADVRQLSPSLPILALVVGLVLWLAGWWSHRFWMVLAFTVLGGTWGLQGAAVLKAQPLVAAIGVGLASGILALTVARLGAFAAGGYAGLLVSHAAFPTWDQPLLCFLVGAFLGFFLFRFWTMAITSLTGVVIMGYSALAIADRLGHIDAVNWSDLNSTALTATGGGMALSGFVIQLLVDRLWRGGKGDKKDGKKSKGDGVLASSFAVFRKAG